MDINFFNIAYSLPTSCVTLGAHLSVLVCSHLIEAHVDASVVIVYLLELNGARDLLV